MTGIKQRSIIDPSHNAEDMRRLTALWRYGREILPIFGSSFDSWLNQLDMMIDAKTRKLPFLEHPMHHSENSETAKQRPKSTIT